MRVLGVLPDLRLGGAQRTMVNLMRHLPAHGFAAELAVLTDFGADSRWDESIEAVAHLSHGRARDGILPLRRRLRADPPDILFTTMVGANVAGWLARLGGSSVPHVVRETNSHRARGDLGSLTRALVRRSYRAADRVVALSHGVGEELATDYALDRARLVTIGNPVETLAFARTPDATDPWPAATKGTVRLLAVGRLTRQKGFDLLLEALARLERVDVTLAILGEGPDRAMLEARARALGIAERVHLPGAVGDVATWYAFGSLFVLSSRWEGFGHVVVEAMAAGLPVLATDCPHGPRDIIRDEESGRLVAPDDPGALAAGLTEALSAPDRLTAWAEAGRARAAAFEASRIAERYAALFRGVLSGEVRDGG